MGIRKRDFGSLVGEIQCKERSEGRLVSEEWSLARTSYFGLELGELSSKLTHVHTSIQFLSTKYHSQSTAIEDLLQVSHNWNEPKITWLQS